MKCPFCSSENTRVIDSRPADDNNSIRRRRLCDECGKRFTTYEKVETIKTTTESSMTVPRSKRVFCEHVINARFLSIRSISLSMRLKRRFSTERKRRFRAASSERS